MKNEIITIENLSFDYGDHRVLENINLKIHDDDFVGIIGPNGSGNQLIENNTWFTHSYRGRVFLFNKTPKEGRRYVGYVPQYAHIDRNFPISVEQVVLMERIGHTDFLRRYSKIDRDIAENVMKIMGILDLRIHKLVNCREAISKDFNCQSSSTEPKLLLLDESTANIDPQAETNFYDFLQNFQKNGNYFSYS